VSRRVRSRSSEPVAVVPDEDGKVLAGCPQCGEQLLVKAELLDEKIECPSCHRVFFPRKTAGQRVKRPDHSKTYMVFGGAVVLIVASFLAISSMTGKKPPPSTATPPAEKKVAYTRSSHPRAVQVLNWAQAIRNDNQLVFARQTDIPSAAKIFGLPPANKDDVLRAVATHKTTQLLRDMEVQRAALLSDDAMTAATGKALVSLSPRAGTDDFVSNTEAEFEVAFQMDAEQVKVTDWHLVKAPQKNAQKARK